MFVVCGEALFDAFLPEDVDKAASKFPLSTHAGGSPYNVARGLRRLGQDVALLTGVSNDFLGDRLMATLQAEKVSCHLIARKEAPTTLSLIEKNAEGVPNYAFYGNGAADRLVNQDDVNFDCSDVSGIHMGSYSLVVQPTADALLALAQRESGKRLMSLDPNIRLNVEPDVQVWRDRIEALISLVDVVKVSDEDLELLYPDKEPESIVKQWMQKGLKLAVLTRGSQGATLWSQQAEVTLQAPSVAVVDTVGAGDSFQAAMINSLMPMSVSSEKWADALNEDTLRQIGEQGICTAAIVCSRAGADMANAPEVEAFIKSYQS